MPAFRHSERDWTIEGVSKVAYLDAMRFTQWFNLLGAPAAVIPVGTARPIGLPIGVQIAGRPARSTNQVLAIAAAVERAFGYKPPPLATQTIEANCLKRSRFQEHPEPS